MKMFRYPRKDWAVKNSLTSMDRLASVNFEAVPMPISSRILLHAAVS